MLRETSDTSTSVRSTLSAARAGAANVMQAADSQTSARMADVPRWLCHLAGPAWKVNPISRWLLACPNDPVHPGDLRQVEAVVGVFRIEAAQFYSTRRSAGEVFWYHLAAPRAAPHTGATPGRGGPGGKQPRPPPEEGVPRHR